VLNVTGNNIVNVGNYLEEDSNVEIVYDGN
jgi:hypothetical protein